MKGIGLTNIQVAELLAREGEKTKPPLQRALRKAARSAFLWPEEAAEVVHTGRSLTELQSIGPYLEKLIRAWIENPPKISDIPDVRKNFMTLTEARRILAIKPGWAKLLRGDLQMHTEWSDGTGTVRAMADAAKEKGYEYIGITDHAKGLKIAGGINEAELREQGREIQAVNHELEREGNPLRVLRSIEMNLNVQGQGDMEEKALAELDIVLGAFHSALRKTDDQTERYLAGLRQPKLNILGHPRCRIFNYRNGLNADWPRVFALAAELDKAVEIDSYPDRQDLSLELLHHARATGTRISLGTDSHHPWQLGFIELGLAAALAAKIPKERIINFMPRKELLQWAQETRH
jgi:histidinol phosphatase-like PHP family hydrolase